MTISRRSFVRYASLAAAGNAAGLNPFAAMNGLAATTPAYKALVCIFMYGGNDSNNTLVPMNTGDNGYATYSGIRGPLAIPISSLAPLGASAAGNYGVHPSLGTSAQYTNMPSIQSLFNQNKLAFVANVGTLIKHITPAQFQTKGNTVPLPVNLFSHPDQQREWQNASQSSAVNTGWAGRVSDNLAPTYNPNAQIPLIASVYGDTVFCNGANSTPVAVAPGNLAGGQCSEGAACDGRTAAAQRIVNFQSGLSLVEADNNITTNAYKYMSILATAVQSVSPLQTVFPTNNSLAAQLQQIAQIMQVNKSLGVSRQIFFAGLGNFDTHANQLPTQAALLSLLSPAMGAFYQATQELGLHDQVTTFTMSDFSRALQPNSNFGSDHAWGGHHMVMGGAVQGGHIYGTYPTLALGGPNDADVNGRWIPTTSSSQYAATLASWFGVSNTDLYTIFPSLSHFGTINLGFV